MPEGARFAPQQTGKSVFINYSMYKNIHIIKKAGRRLSRQADTYQILVRILDKDHIKYYAINKLIEKR
jgi:hypothetical protein